MDEVASHMLVLLIEYVDDAIRLAHAVERAHWPFQGPLKQKLTLAPDLEQVVAVSELLTQTLVHDLAQNGGKV